MRTAILSPLFTLFLVAIAGGSPLSAAFDFSPAGTLPVGSTPNELFPADLDGDGQTDLIVRSATDLSWLRADSAGGFLPAQTILTIEANDVAVGDLNSDGIPDLVVGGNTGLVSVHFGAGQGVFTAGPTISGATSFAPVECADINADGNLDVITTRPLASGTFVLAVHPGDGLGGLLAPIEEPVGTTPRELLVTDLDADGDLDLVTGHFNISQFGGSFGIVTNLGAGSLAPMVSISTPGPVIGLSAGRFDGGSFVDLVVVAFTPSSFCGSHAHLYLADGFGSFTLETVITGACGPHSARVADFDGDGISDLLTTDGGDFVPGANWVDVHRGVGNGTLLAPELFTINIATLEPPALLDFDADGQIDFAVAGLATEVALYRNTSLLAGDLFRRGDTNSSGALEAIADAIFLLNYGFSGGAAPTCLSTADVDDDGQVNAIADAIGILSYGFTSGPPPQAPFPDCGVDPTSDALRCLDYGAGLCP